MKKDVVILGAGPVGLFAGFYCGMRQLSVGIVDQLETVGGQLSALYPEKSIFDVAGFKEIKAQDLVDNLEEQLSRFEATTDIILNNQIVKIEKIEEGKFIITTDKMEIEAGAIIIAAGNGGFSARKLGLENETEFSNIDYFIKKPEVYNGKKVAIFGGGDSAVDFALMLEKVAKEVHIIHRRDQFRAHEHSVKMLEKSSVQIHTPFTAKELKGTNGIIDQILIGSKTEEKVIEIDNVICNYGFVSKLGPVEDFGLELEGKKIIVNSRQHTNIPGIMAIGDICTYPGKPNLIINGFGEGPIAVNEAYQYINPEATIGTLHSSSVLGE